MKFEIEHMQNIQGRKLLVKDDERMQKIMDLDIAENYNKKNFQKMHSPNLKLLLNFFF